MSKKVLLFVCACMCGLPATAHAAVAPDTAASPPDLPASVNADPNGVWTTSALAGAHGATVVAPADAVGCPSGYGCGWVNSNYGGAMGRWAGNNPHLSAFGQSQCGGGNWNDCISSIDNDGTSGCNLNWTWDSSYQGTVWSERDHVAHGSIGSSNDQFSSDYWCST